MLEPMLAFLHISAVLALVVFASSEAALCRAEWMNAAVVERLVRVNAIGWVASAVLLLSGLARMVWGDKGWAWLASNPLLHLKLALFAVVLVLAVQPARRYRRWHRALQAGGGLPPTAEIRAARRSVMIQTHLIALIPLAAVFLARGWGR